MPKLEFSQIEFDSLSKIIESDESGSELVMSQEEFDAVDEYVFRNQIDLEDLLGFLTRKDEGTTKEIFDAGVRGISNLAVSAGAFQEAVGAGLAAAANAGRGPEPLPEDRSPQQISIG